MQFIRHIASDKSLAVEVFMERFQVAYAVAKNMAIQATRERLMVSEDGQYQVTISQVFPGKLDGWYEFVHLSVVRLQGTESISWDTLQDIKNSLIGPECEAIEVYPAESRLVNCGSNRHLWVFLDESFRIPMGWTSRMVQGENMNPHAP